jgi:hypothetical protein
MSLHLIRHRKNKPSDQERKWDKEMKVRYGLKPAFRMNVIVSVWFPRVRLDNKNGTRLLLFYKLSREPAESKQYCSCLYLTRVGLK